MFGDFTVWNDNTVYLHPKAYVIDVAVLHSEVTVAQLFR